LFLITTAALAIAAAYLGSGLLAGEDLISGDALVGAGLLAVIAALGIRHAGRFVFRAGNRAALLVTEYLAPSKLASPGTRVGPGYLIAKRLLDFSAALVGLIVLSPLFLVLAILVRVDDGGPLFFRQERVGQFGRTFQMIKLRTMAVDNDESVHRRHVALVSSGPGTLRLDDDPRITRVGEYLRRWSLDETPNLINVLLGQMSLVGPRPLVPYEVDHQLERASLRFQAKQGMTGLAQISGRLHLSPQERADLDVAYALNRSMWLDLKLLISTLPAVFRLRG
jgi:lipopolysaccharide/colanic/teichoic acid biosynthesis glycosyltransferase